MVQCRLDGYQSRTKRCAGVLGCSLPSLSARLSGGGHEIGTLGGLEEGGCTTGGCCGCIVCIAFKDTNQLCKKDDFDRNEYADIAEWLLGRRSGSTGR